MVSKPELLVFIFHVRLSNRKRYTKIKQHRKVSFSLFSCDFLISFTTLYLNLKFRYMVDDLMFILILKFQVFSMSERKISLIFELWDLNYKSWSHDCLKWAWFVQIRIPLKIIFPNIYNMYLEIYWHDIRTRTMRQYHWRPKYFGENYKPWSHGCLNGHDFYKSRFFSKLSFQPYIICFIWNIFFELWTFEIYDILANNFFKKLALEIKPQSHHVNSPSHSPL